MSKPNDFRPILVNLVQTIPTPQVSAEKGRTCLSAGCRCMQYPNGKGGPQRIEKGFKNQSSNLAGSWYGVDIQVQLWCVDATWEQWYSQYAGCSIHVDIWLRFPQKNPAINTTPMRGLGCWRQCNFAYNYGLMGLPQQECRVTPLCGWIQVRPKEPMTHLLGVKILTTLLQPTP